MRVLGIACGNGVIVYPFKKHLIAGIEIRSIFRTPGDVQWRLNFGNIPIFKDFKDYLRWSVASGDHPKDIDLVIGAPDCGHSSMLALSRAKKFSNPKSNESLTMFLKAVKHVNPKIFLMENLEKLLETVSKEELEIFFDNYQLIFHLGSVMQFGNSQKNRVRLVLVGVRRGLDLPISHFKKIYQIHTPKFTGDLLKGLVYGENAHITEDISSTITLYAGFKDTLENIRDKWLEKNWTRWEVDGRNFKNAPGVYRNLVDTYPNTARKANRQFNPDGYQMSPRELARIMGIPDRFKIHFDDDKLGYWINKGRVTATKTCPMEIPIWIYRQMKRVWVLKDWA